MKVTHSMRERQFTAEIDPTTEARHRPPILTPAHHNALERTPSATAPNPLVDGNKRTAWLAAATFLALNGVDLAGVDQDTAYALVIDVASGAEGDIGAIAGRLRRL
ncbi:hypothetical protein OHB06_20975 [Streptomyces sp. NBC_01604]|uniref:hypothetical protein n=1 Tax=Streptomyces sp. NBC_01604 TaxID=2975894 RepID=UPI00386D816B